MTTQTKIFNTTTYFNVRYANSFIEQQIKVDQLVTLVTEIARRKDLLRNNSDLLLHYESSCQQNGYDQDEFKVETVVSIKDSEKLNKLLTKIIEAEEQIENLFCSKVIFERTDYQELANLAKELKNSFEETFTN